MCLAPRIPRERGTNGVIGLSLNDQHHAMRVGEWPAKDDESGVDKLIHEGRVR